MQEGPLDRLKALRARIEADSNLSQDERTRLMGRADSVMSAWDSPADEPGRETGLPKNTRFDDLMTRGATRAGAWGVRGIPGGAAGLLELPIRGAEAAIPGDARPVRNFLDKYGPARGYEEIASLIESRLKPAETGGEVAADVVGTLAGVGGSIAATGPVALRGAASKAPWLKKLMDSVGDMAGAKGFAAKRGLETAAATPFNAGQAVVPENSAAHNLAPLKDLDPSSIESPGMRALAHVGQGLGKLSEKADQSDLGRFGFETALDVTAGSALAGAGLGLKGLVNKVNPLPKLKQRIADLETEAYVDAATGLQNKNSMARAKGRIDSDPEMEWVMVDLGNLKAVNDNVSHEAGDAYIKSAADLLRQTGGEMGVSERQIFRWEGGDEFFVGLPKGQGREFAQRVGEGFKPTEIGETGFKTGIDAGWGNTADEADAAVRSIKGQKQAQGGSYRPVRAEPDVVAPTLASAPAPVEPPKSLFEIRDELAARRQEALEEAEDLASLRAAQQPGGDGPSLGEAPAVREAVLQLGEDGVLVGAGKGAKSHLELNTMLDDAELKLVEDADDPRRIFAGGGEPDIQARGTVDQPIVDQPGNFAHVADEVFQGLADSAQKDGGFTVDLNSGDRISEGYSVGVHKDREKALEGFTPEELRGYAAKNADALAEPGASLGGWTDDGKLYLDVSSTVKNLDEAVALGRKHDQIAIWGHKEGDNVWLKDTDNNPLKKPQVGGERPKGTGQGDMFGTQGSVASQVAVSLGLTGAAYGVDKFGPDTDEMTVLKAGLGAVGMAALGGAALKGTLKGSGIIDAATAASMKMKDKMTRALNGWDDPEAFGAVLLWRHNDLDRAGWLSKMKERFGEGFDEAQLEKSFKKSTKFLEGRLNEVLDPDNPMPAYEKIVELVKMGKEKFQGDEWYHEIRPAVVEMFGEENADPFLRALAATSAGAGATTSNINFAVKAMLQHKLALPFTPTPKTPASKIEKSIAQSDGIISSGQRKVNSYNSALGGNRDAVVNDLWIHRLFGWGKIAHDGKKWKLQNAFSDPQYRFAEEAIRMMGRELDLPGGDVQAAAWSGIKHTWEDILKKSVIITEKFNPKAFVGKQPEGAVGQTAFKHSPRNDTPEPYRQTLLRRLGEDKELQRVVQGVGSLEDAEASLRKWGGNAADDMVDAFRATVADEVAQAAGRKGIPTEALAETVLHAGIPATGKELLQAGAGAGVAMAASPEEYDLPAAMAGAAIGTGRGRQAIFAISDALGKHSKATIPAAEAIFSGFAASKAATEDDKRKAYGWGMLAAASGAVAAREAIPALKGVEKVVGKELVWDKMIVPSVNFMRTKAYEVNPAVGHFFAPGHRLGDDYKAVKAAWRSSLNEGKYVAEDLFGRIDALGPEADKILSQAIDVRDMDPETLLSRLKAADVSDPEGAVSLLADIHGTFTNLGEALVGLQMLRKETVENMTGRYAPRLYTGDKDAALRTEDGGIKLKGLERLMQRGKLKDSNKPRLIQSAKTRTAVGVLQESYLAATEQFFHTLGSAGKWVNPEGYDLRGQLRLARSALKRAGEGATNEMAAEVATLTNKVAKLDETMAGKAGWVQLPKGKKLGSLSESWVTEDLAFELNGIQRLPTMVGDAESYFKDVYLKGLKAWKIGKTAYNPGTHGRNIVAAQLLSWLGDGPTPFGSSWQRAMGEAKSKKGSLYELGKKHGLVQDSNLTGELKALRSGGEVSDGAAEAVEATVKKSGGFARKTHERILEVYHSEDVAARLAYFHDATTRRKLSPEDAAAQAKKWIPAYENISQFTRTVSRYGPPFFAYTSQALPMVAEAMSKNPIRFLAMAAGISGMRNIFVDQPMPDEYKPRNMEGPLASIGGLPDWAKSTAGFLLPSYVARGQDPETKKESYLDFTYVMPWGDLAEGTSTRGGVPNTMDPLGNPFVKTAAEFVFNKDRFTGREVTTPSMTTGEKAKTWADKVGKMALPSMTPGVGWGYAKLRDAVKGTPNYMGDVRSVDSATRDVVFGMKERQLDPEVEKNRRQWEIRTEMQDVRSQIRSLNRDRSIVDDDERQRLIEAQVRKLTNITERFNRLNAAGSSN